MKSKSLTLIAGFALLSSPLSTYAADNRPNSKSTKGGSGFVICRTKCEGDPLPGDLIDSIKDLAPAQKECDLLCRSQRFMASLLSPSTS
jgi:hypothetical protein